MMKGNKYKKIVLSVLVLLIVGTIYIFSPYKLEYYGYGHKVMAHRVNSVEKLAYTERFYAGVELDLIYDSEHQIFDVNHPPALSIGLDLETYLSNIYNKELKLWLDIKNISSENAVEASKILSRQITASGLKKENILVESTEIQYLYLFKNEGFTTSFYLPYFLYEQDETTLLTTIDSLNLLKSRYTVDGISADVLNYDILNKYFKNDRKFLWALYPAHSRRQIRNYKNFRKYVSDPSVEIVLVKVALPIGDR